MSETTRTPAPRQRRKPARSLRLYGQAGDELRVLQIREGDKLSHFYVREIPAACARGFRLERYLSEQVADRPNSYDVLIAPRQSDDLCECPGHLRWGHRTVCRHRAALRALMAEGRLPAPPPAC